MFMQLNVKMPTSLNKRDHVTETTSNWHLIFKLPYLSAREIQLQALQYRHIHSFVTYP